MQAGVHLQDLVIVPAMLLDHLYKVRRLLGAARQLWAKLKNSLHLYFFFKISEKICPEAKEGKLFVEFFVDRMIL